MAQGTRDKKKTHFHCNMTLFLLLGFWCLKSRNNKGRWRHWWTITMSLFNWSHCNIFSNCLWLPTEMRCVANIQRWSLTLELWLGLMSMVPRKSYSTHLANVRNPTLVIPLHISTTYGSSLFTSWWWRVLHPAGSSLGHTWSIPPNLVIMESPSSCKQFSMSSIKQRMEPSHLLTEPPD